MYRPECIHGRIAGAVPYVCRRIQQRCSSLSLSLSTARPLWSLPASRSGGRAQARTQPWPSDPNPNPAVPGLASGPIVDGAGEGCCCCERKPNPTSSPAWTARCDACVMQCVDMYRAGMVLPHARRFWVARRDKDAKTPLRFPLPSGRTAGPRRAGSQSGSRSGWRWRRHSADTATCGRFCPVGSFSAIHSDSHAFCGDGDDEGTMRCDEAQSADGQLPACIRPARPLSLSLALSLSLSRPRRREAMQASSRSIVRSSSSSAMRVRK